MMSKTRLVPSILHSVRQDVLLLTAATLLAACGGDSLAPSLGDEPGDAVDAPPEQPGPARVAFVTLSPIADTVMLMRATVYAATLKDSAGNVLDKRAITWRSDDSLIAAIKPRDGTPETVALVTAKAPGSTVISATAEGVRGAASITVPPLVFASIDAGRGHTCALTTEHWAYCWGWNASGALGDGTVVDHPTPYPTYGDIKFSLLSAAIRRAGGGGHTCGVASVGTAYCWGAAGFGELGNGALNPRAQPVPIAGGLSFSAVTAGGQHSCGLTSDGVAYCWGSNASGQLGALASDDCSGTPCGLTPAMVFGGRRFTSISAGGLHTCALTGDGTAFCWGDNSASQLGDSTSTQRGQPVAVRGGFHFRTISAGGQHTCAITVGNRAYCWGSRYGLGIGVWQASPVPLPVASDLEFEQLSSGGAHVCALTPSGDAHCWGMFEGTGTVRLSPQPVPGGLMFESVDGGGDHTCGVTSEGVAYCWGANWIGQLGDGTSTNQKEPTRVFGSASRSG
jgi:alpha-tubulin suppressor-like RCC1 family protein